jgi:two-component sensor histidine kinase
MDVSQAQSSDTPVAGALSAAAREVSEARHKMANVFQLLSTLTRLRIQRSGDDEARRQLSWMLDAVSVLALLHNQPPSAEGPDFSRFLREMGGLWRRRCGDRPIDIQLDLAPLAVHERHESALALIAHELVVNAIAHGFPGGAGGAVRVAFGPGQGDTGVLTISDTGCGYDPVTVTRTRLGLWLIEGLASQVQGALTTTFDGGVQARLVFPLPSTEQPCV